MNEGPIIVLIVFSFVALVSGMGIIGGIYKEKAKAKAEKNDDKYVDYDLRLTRLEERIANLETIVLEKERDKKFSSL